MLDYKVLFFKEYGIVNLDTYSDHNSGVECTLPLLVDFYFISSNRGILYSPLSTLSSGP